MDPRPFATLIRDAGAALILKAVNLVPELSAIDSYCIAHPVAAHAASR